MVDVVLFFRHIEAIFRRFDVPENLQAALIQPYLNEKSRSVVSRMDHGPKFVQWLWQFGVVVSALVSINEVNLRRAWSVLRWVTVSGVQLLVRENLSQYITSHPGQLSLAIPPWVGAMGTSLQAVMPCGWEVKAGMVREWVAGKTVRSPCYHGPYLSALAMGSSYNK